MSRSRSSGPTFSEMRGAARREARAVLEKQRAKHRERMKRARTREAEERRGKQILAAVEVGGTAAAAGAARAFLGDKMDVGPVPLELPLAAAGHAVGFYFFSDDPMGDHVHNVSNGLMAVAAFQGSQRAVQWARERMNRGESSEGGAAAGYEWNGALPHAAPPRALPPPPMPPVVYAQPQPQVVYVQPTASAGAAAPAAASSASRALAEAIRLTEPISRV